MSKPRDITGKRFGRLIVLARSGNIGKKSAWECQCDCGSVKLVAGPSLYYGETRSCGCYGREVSPKSKLHDLTGRQVGKLTVIRQDLSTKHPKPVWVCRCDCGNETRVRAGNLQNRNVRSCGCLLRRIGPDNPQWKGGKSTKGGYVMITWRDDEGKKKSTPEHRLVMEKILGRPLLRNENVHHKNGVKSDNHPENLELWVKVQPCGQRVEDILEHCVTLLKLYAPERLSN